VKIPREIFQITIFPPTKMWVENAENSQQIIEITIYKIQNAKKHH